MPKLSLSSTSTSESTGHRPRYYEKSSSETSETEMTSTNSDGESGSTGERSTAVSAQTLTSGETEVAPTESSSISSNDTSYGLVSLVSEYGNCYEFLQVPPEDVNYLVAVRDYMRDEPVYRWKKPKNKTVRRLQIVPHGRSYSRLFREVRRRQPRQPFKFEDDDISEVDSSWMEMLSINGNSSSSKDN